MLPSIKNKYIKVLYVYTVLNEPIYCICVFISIIFIKVLLQSVSQHMYSINHQQENNQRINTNRKYS